MPMIEVRKVVEIIDPANIRAAIAASGISGRELNRRLKAHGNLITRVINGKRAFLTEDEFTAIANALAGEGDYEGRDPDDVMKVMRGEARFQRTLVVDNAPKVPKPTLEVVRTRRVAA